LFLGGKVEKKRYSRAALAPALFFCSGKSAPTKQRQQTYTKISEFTSAGSGKTFCSRKTLVAPQMSWSLIN
jgi:hypothetical protein